MAKRDYPVVRDKKKNKFFPLGGERRSQVWVNDPSLEENRRRLRDVDPLIDGWDPKENPVRAGRPRRSGNKIPIR